MVDLTRKYDVLVIGGGNAALCAAISALTTAKASVTVSTGVSGWRAKRAARSSPVSHSITR